jgi:hypothetical protein
MATATNKKPAPPATTKAQIRKAACLGSAYVGCAGFVIALYFGASVGYAVSAGAAVAISGLAAWTVYHLVSGNNNGLGFLGMSVGTVVLRPNNPPMSFLVMLLICLGALLPIAWINGMTTRSRDRHASKAVDPPHPMLDHETDSV